MLIGVKEDDKRRFMPAIGGRYLISGIDVEPQCSHNDFEDTAGLSSGF